MLAQAIQKLQAEMDKEKNNSYVQVVGGFLLQHLNEHPDCADKIMAGGKSIAGSLTEMRTEAEKKKVGNSAVLTDQEGFSIVLKYFGIDDQQPQANAAHGPAAPTPEPAAEPESIFDISLDDLL
jgi:hypothetical protein